MPIAVKSFQSENNQITVGVRYCMPTFFLRKIVISLSILVIGCSVCLGGILRDWEKDVCRSAVYFVVHQTESVEAAATDISFRGGAGYVISEDEVAFGVYFTEREALETVENIEDTYPTAIVKQRFVAFADEKTLNTVCACLCIVDGWLDVLENGGRQSVVKNGLNETARVLSRGGESGRNKEVVKIARELEGISQGIVYARELRYFLCWAVDVL